MKIADIKFRNCMWVDVPIEITRSQFKQRFLVDLDLSVVVGKTINWADGSVGPLLIDDSGELVSLDCKRSEKEAETAVEVKYEDRFREKK
jgi:hypothetical protein